MFIIFVCLNMCMICAWYEFIRCNRVWLRTFILKGCSLCVNSSLIHFANIFCQGKFLRGTQNNCMKMQKHLKINFPPSSIFKMNPTALDQLTYQYILVFKQHQWSCQSVWTSKANWIVNQRNLSRKKKKKVLY